MKLVLTITIFLVILSVVDESRGWRRRRRRRRRTPPPAPEPNCIVSSKCFDINLLRHTANDRVYLLLSNDLRP